MTVAMAQRRMSSREFLRWKVYLDQDLNAFHREDYMLAKIAQEVRRSYIDSKHRMDVTLDDMLVEFTFKESQPVIELTPEERRAWQLQNSKNFWMALVGFDTTPRMPPTKKAP